MEIAGVTLTNPDRVLFADQGLTKADLARYYEAVGPCMLPHVAERPLTLVRCPQGQGKACFFQKHWTTETPAGLGTVTIREENGDREPYAYVTSVSGLIALVQYGVLEIHIWGARQDELEKPDRLVFDFDPAPDVPWEDTLAAAQGAHALLAEYGLRSWLKTSGGKGLHVVVPFTRGPSWEDAHAFAEAFTARLLEAHPGKLVDVASKAARPGRIYVDYQRNARGATTVAPWSTRAREGAPVSVPVPWTRAGRLVSGNALDTTKAAAYARRTREDPWSTLRRSRQRLGATVMRAVKEPRRS